MGVLRFLVPRREDFPEGAAERAYLAGLDEIPWRTRATWTATGLDVQRAEGDSGNFFMPTRVAGHGELILSTASLMEREPPYHLQVELARGTLNRLRNQIGLWESLGMNVPAVVKTGLHAAHEQLSWAVTRQTDPQDAADKALRVIQLSLDEMWRLNQTYVEQALAARHRQSPRLNTLWGINLGSAHPGAALAGPLIAACNTAMTPLTWRDIEAQQGRRDWSLYDEQVDWARASGLRLIGGPLLAIDKQSLPDWMYLWGEEDEESFRSCVAEHVREVVTRYRGKVQLWHCAARLNMPNEFDHSEEQRLRLAVGVIETIRSVDPRTPIVISVDQPWGAFMSREDCDLSPLHFADALVRAELGLAGIGLEINFAYVSGGSEARDVLEFGRQMDRWSGLGMPLLVMLCAPSGSGPDAQARSSARPLSFAAGELTPEAQRAWAETYLPTLLAKQPVQGVVWQQLSDAAPHEFPHGGMVDAHNQPKPLFELWRTLRAQHLI